MLWWKAWENVLGAPPSEPPAIYWTPGMGQFHVGPDTIGLLTPGQLYAVARSGRSSG